MKRLLLLACALLAVSCSRSQTQVQLKRVLFVPSRDRVLAAGDTEPAATSWLPMGLSFESAKPVILYGLVLADAPLLDDARKATGSVVPDRSRVIVGSATPWEKEGRGYRRLYRVRMGQKGREGFLDSSAVALVLAESGSLAAGIVERKIDIAGGESQYNVLALSDKGAVTLIDTSSLVFPDAFHPSGAVRLSIEDVNSEGAPKVVLEADTIVSLQFLGASPLRWRAWLQDRQAGWAVIFRFNESYGTDQGNSSRASSRAFSSSGSGFLDTIKVTTDIVETAAQGEFRTTTESFYKWDGSVYREDGAQSLPQLGTVIAGAELRTGPAPRDRPVESLHDGDQLYIFDRSDAPQSMAGEQGFWYHALSRTGKDGWIHAGTLKLSKIDPLKENQESFLGRSAFTPLSPLSP